jgi:very-short-patch-repair endonuclease
MSMAEREVQSLRFDQHYAALLAIEDIGEVAARERLSSSVEASQFGSRTEMYLFWAIALLLTRGGASTSYGIGRSEPIRKNEIGRIYLQHPIGSYHADILIDCHFQQLLITPLRLVVECDGPWHDKTTQYHADRRRDRWMQAHGYTVFRFPTNEVNSRGMESAFDCAIEIHNAIKAHIARQEDYLFPVIPNILRALGHKVEGGPEVGVCFYENPRS